jgi:hypothetical protein
MKGKPLIDAILANANELTKPRRRFLSHMLMLFLAIRHRINFLQLERHSDRYCEHAMRLQFEQVYDFAHLNGPLIQQHGSGHFLLAFDPSYLPKSGKATPGTGHFWSGCAQRTQWGLEVSLLSVIDVDYKTAWHLDAVQTPAKAERDQKQISLLDHYAQVVIWQTRACEILSGYLALDAYFAKAPFIDRILQKTGLQIVGLLRQDARLRYLYEGGPTGRKGRPRQYAGFVDFKALDFGYFQLSYQDEELRIYSAVVNCPFLKRNIKLAYTQYLDEQGWPVSYKLYFSTDVHLTAWQVVKYYRLRYQQEFLIRDAKQFTGFSDCQARSVNKLEYHVNTSLSAVNVAKVEQGPSHQPFSMADVKTLYHNQLLLDQLFSLLPSSVQSLKNDPQVQQLYRFGAIAA